MRLRVRVRWFYYIARFAVRATLFVSTNWQVRGRENIPSRGPLLIVANHLNLADPPIVSVSISRTTMFMAKEELFRPRFTGYFISSFGAFPVRRGQLDTKALRQALQVLADGQALVVFPEATRSPNAQLQTAFSGAALIALRSGAPILPIGITGSEKMKGKTWLRRPRVTVTIGKPFHLPADAGKATRTELTRMTDLMMEHIAELLPVQYRGVYSSVQRGKK